MSFLYMCIKLQRHELYEMVLLMLCSGSFHDMYPWMTRKVGVTPREKIDNVQNKVSLSIGGQLVNHGFNLM